MDTPTDDRPFEAPLKVSLRGQAISVTSARQAYDLLADAGWPGPRDVRHQEACETCLKVLEGHRATSDAVEAFRGAAEEAGILK